jgi:hypothetical protein
MTVGVFRTGRKRSPPAEDPFGRMVDSALVEGLTIDER